MRLGQQSLKQRPKSPATKAASAAAMETQIAVTTISLPWPSRRVVPVCTNRAATFSTISAHIPRHLFAEILRLIAELRPPPAASTAQWVRFVTRSMKNHLGRASR
jgi:hypothetical protein